MRLLSLVGGALLCAACDAIGLAAANEPGGLPLRNPSVGFDEADLVEVRPGLRAFNPHRPLAHEHLGSGHTHCAPDHSNIEAAAQETRLRDLPGEHAQRFVWMTAHDFVAPDPGVDGIEHLFGVEIYSRRLASGQAPHMVALLPDGRLADPRGQPFGRYRDEMQEVADNVQQAGGLAVLAHPTRYSPAEQEVIDLDEALWGIEAISAATDIDGNLEYIDARLSAQKYTCLSAGTDLHGGDYGFTWGTMLVPSDREVPRRADLVRQVRQCNFFVCRVQDDDVPPLRGLRVGIEGGEIRFGAQGSVDSVQFIGRQGRVLHTVDGAGARSASYRPTGDETYIRLDVRRAAGQARCLSQPIWLVSEQN